MLKHQAVEQCNRLVGGGGLSATAPIGKGCNTQIGGRYVVPSSERAAGFHVSDSGLGPVAPDLWSIKIFKKIIKRDFFWVRIGFRIESVGIRFISF